MSHYFYPFVIYIFNIIYIMFIKYFIVKVKIYKEKETVGGERHTVTNMPKYCRYG